MLGFSYKDALGHLMRSELADLCFSMAQNLEVVTVVESPQWVSSRGSVHSVPQGCWAEHTSLQLQLGSDLLGLPNIHVFNSRQRCSCTEMLLHSTAEMAKNPPIKSQWEHLVISLLSKIFAA